MSLIEIRDRKIGPGHPCFIIAEAGINHNGDLNLAQALVRAAKKAGADAVKFQTFRADRLVTRAAPQADYQRRNSGCASSQYEMLRRLELSEEDFRTLADLCHDLEIMFLSSPFDEQSADALAGLGMPLFKIPSGEITNLPHIAHIARIGRPIILSTGMSFLAEVENAIRCVETNGNPPLALLHCVSLYPCEAARVNLRAMHALQGAFELPVGYSDHTLGIEVALAAVTLGACIVEKHLTLDRGMPGPDHLASSDPDEFARLVGSIRNIEAAFGNGRKTPAEGEAEIAMVARKSLVASRDIGEGDVLTSDLIAVRRPGNGLPPTFLPHVLGRRLRRPVLAGAVLTLEMLH